MYELESGASAATMDQARPPAVAIYSPTQAAVGALLGGPVGLICFLHSNFTALGRISSARLCLILGAALLVALVAVIPHLPEKMPGTSLNIAYIVTARYVAEKYQISKSGIADSPQFTFRSNWAVLGVGLLCLLGSVVLVLGPIMALRFFRVIA